MLLGEHRQVLNNKGQFVVPRPMHRELAGGLVITRGFERNLLIFPPQRWQKLAEKLLSEPISNGDIRTLRRRLFAAAEEMTIDAQGRVTLPVSLRDFAGISGEIVLSGMYDYVELWSAERWLPILEAVESDFSEKDWDGINV